MGVTEVGSLQNICYSSDGPIARWVEVEAAKMLRAGQEFSRYSTAPSLGQPKPRISRLCVKAPVIHDVG